MGSDRTSEKEQLTGFIVPREDWAYWPEQSTVTLAQRIPGPAVPGRKTLLRVIPSGTPATGADFDIRAAAGGEDGEFAWRPDGGTYRGWEPPCIVANVERVDTTDGVGASMVSTVDGKLLLAIERDLGSGSRRVVVYVRDTDGSWDSGTTIINHTVPSASSTRYLLPRLVVEPDGAVSLFCCTYTGGSAQNFCAVRRYLTVDAGGTWELASLRCLELSVASNELTSLRIATSGSQWLMFTTQADAVVQYWSLDGDVFYRVPSAVTADGRMLDVVFHGGYFHALLTFDTSTNTNDVYVYRLGSASSLITESSASVQLSAEGDTNWPQGCLFVEDSGRIWALFEATGATGAVCSAHSDDTGASWVPTGTTSVEPTICIDYVKTTLAGVSGAFALGSGWLVLEVPSSNGPLDVVQLGGWSTTAIGVGGTDYVVASSTQARVMDAVTKYPITWTRSDVNIDTSGFFTGSHTGTPTIVGGSISGVAGEEAKYSLTSASTAERYRMGIVYQLDPTTWASGARARVTLELRVNASATVSYAVTVSATEGGNLEATDVASAGSLGSTTLTLTEPIQVKVEVSRDAKASVWYRRITAAVDPADREWTSLVTGGTLTDNGGSATDITLQFDDSAGAAWNTKIDWFAAYAGERSQADGTAIPTRYGGQAAGIASDYSNLGTRSWSTEPLYVYDGVSVAGLGVGRRNDTWSITPGSRYHPNYALATVRPSPRHPFRSADTTARVLAYQRSAAGDVHNDHHLLGVYFNACNFRQVLIEGYAGGSWSTLGTHNAYLSVGSCATSASGKSAIPVTSGTGGSSPYFRRDQLAGSWLYDGSDFYEIASNTEGHWDAGAANEKRCTLQLVDAMTASSTIAVDIVFRRSLALIYPAGNNNEELRGLRFTFSSAIAGTYVECGNIVFDDVLVFGAGPDPSRSVVWEVGEKIEEQDDGHIYTDRTRPSRRRVELTWTRTFPLVNAADGDPDYVKASSHASYGPAGDYLDAPMTLHALIGSIGRRPFVYLPRIPLSSSNGVLVSIVKDDAGGAMLGRFVPDSYRLETVHGQAGTQDEVVRGSAVTIREEV